MNEIVVLSLEDGAFHEAGPPVDPPSKQKRIRTLKDWIRKHGKDKKTYRLAAWLTPAISCIETKTMELIEHGPPVDEAQTVEEPEAPEEKEEGPVFLGEPEAEDVGRGSPGFVDPF